MAENAVAASPELHDWPEDELLEMLNVSMGQGSLDLEELRVAWRKALQCPGAEVEVGSSGKLMKVYGGGRRIVSRDRG